MNLQQTYHIPFSKYLSVTSLSRVNNSILGFDQDSQFFVQVDFKHSIVWTHNLIAQSKNQFLTCRQFDNFSLGDGTRNSYVLCFDKKIQKCNFLTTKLPTDKHTNFTLLTSNSLASFTGNFDAYNNTLICMKIHQNHGAYSLNWVEGEREKKIIKLLEFDPRSLYLNRHSPQIIYTDPENQVRYFDIEKPQKETSLIKKSTILFDKDYLYCTSSNLVSKFNDVYQIQTIDLRTGKHGFGFKGNRLPKKIQSFGDYLFYLTERAFYIYDKRKSDPLAQLDLDAQKATNKLSPQRINDFLVQPNLEKIYLSHNNGLGIYDFNFF